MMDGTTVSVVQPVPTLVNSSSVHHSTSTGVTPIDQTSWRPGKRSRITSSLSSTNYNPSPPPPSLQITKSNSSKQYGPKSSPSSLTKPSPKRRKTAADFVTSVAAAVTATSDDPGHYPSNTNWGYSSIPSGPLNYGVEPIVSNATRDHFNLSPTTLTQEQGPERYDWSDNNFAQLTSSSSSLPSVSSPSLPYLPKQEPTSYYNLQGGYLTDYSGLPTSNYPVYSFLPPWNPVKTPEMLVEYRPRLDGGTSLPERRLPGPSPLLLEGRDGDEKSLIEPIDEGWVDLGPSVKKSDNHHDGSAQVSNLSGKSTPIPEEKEDEFWEDDIGDEAAIDGNSPLSHPERRSRSHLSDQNRKETGSTRKLKLTCLRACIRCRMQKIKCKADPKDPRGVDCLTCRNIKLDSKKVIHRLPCLRWKLAEVALFRAGGLHLTKRWDGTKMKDLGPRDWVNSSDVRTIHMIMGSSRPMVLKVKKFTPIEGDVTCKYWVDQKGNKQKIDIEPYALASIWETAKKYEEYIYDYAHPAVREYSQDRQVDSLVRRTYRAASAFIVGEEMLDMKAIDDPECPYRGTIPIPRMIPAQFDSLGHRVLVQLRKLVLEGLWKVMAGKNPHHFYFVYLIVFMLLHEVSFTSADRLRRAKDNNYTEHRYDLATFMEELQEGANNILSHWHYYKRDVNTLMKEIESEDRKNAVWGTLKFEEAKLLIETHEAYREVVEQNLEWEHDLYFVSQMFEENWHPRKTFSR
ncbi:tetratricopeptide repeat domain containing protein [Daldinia childiae]|uniref:tetratricopeptide repeat domain containing protein n=1 Tax=Daldinia childiae TaxID=326645 RepID=UPI0014463E20|nr:tetratricopeptide repeat domain containing protein [Daldinia childiae]KAF3064374.1 tetratricopeptide repeat domain containing protein [Daldinia childiae]